MKFNTAKRSVETGGMNLRVNMKIDMNAKSFSVLSDDMYSDAVSTIVRELSSNARDSHKAAGKQDVAFNVSCPSAFDPYFAVEDFGIGLKYFKFNTKIRNDKNENIVGEISSTIFISGDVRDNIEGIDTLIIDGRETVPVGNVLYDRSSNETVVRVPGEYHGDDVTVEFDDVLVLYSTYFRSTKEETNDYIGAFGLGSKTPFAYTDNFMVRNRFNGVERQYNIYTDEDGMPLVSLMGTTDTTEGNGVEVKIAVDPSDYSEFKEAIETQLVYFDPQPVICNEPVEFRPIVHNGEYFILFDGEVHENSGYYDSKAKASVGDNAYMVSHVNTRLFSGNSAIELKFGIGEVMVTATREELKYSEETVAKIKEREKQAIDEYRTYVLNKLELDDLTSYEKAEFLNTHCRVLELNSSKVKKLVGDPNLRYTVNQIMVCLSGWGDFANVKWNTVNLDDGTTKDILDTYTQPTKALHWSEYEAYNGKTKTINGRVLVQPNQKFIIFVRDNSYAFLKKINHYCMENSVDRHGTKILVLNMFNDGASADAFEMLKPLVKDSAEIIYLSTVELPKNAANPDPDYSPTPTARFFDRQNDRFDTPKYWDGVHTPLTKIDVGENTYVVQSHLGFFDGIEDNDKLFVNQYLAAHFPWDDEIEIYAIPRAKYENAISYGFKPVSELIESLKQNITIPVKDVNGNKLNEMLSDMRGGNMSLYRLLHDLENPMEFIDKGNPVRNIIRLMQIIHNRYDADAESQYDYFVDTFDDIITPEPSAKVQKTLDTVPELWDTVCEKLVLVEDLVSWTVNHEEKLKTAFYNYVNTAFNTGEDNE